MPLRHVIWLGLWAIYIFGVYAPSVSRFRRSKIAQEHTRPLDLVLDMTVFVTWQVLPLIHIFTSWLMFADYPLPEWTVWPGSALMLSAYLVLLLSYRRLGNNWSPKIDVRESQELVTGGIYSRIRHPIYLGIWLWALANPLLLHNWLAGPTMLLTFAGLYFTRVPREEEMMRRRFGENYTAYMRSTGRLFPKKRSG